MLPGEALRSSVYLHYSPKCVEESFSEGVCLEPELLRSESLSDTFPGGLDELGGAYDLFDLGLGAVSPYVVFSEYLPQRHILLHAGEDVIGDLLLTRGEEGAPRAAEEPLPEGSLFAHEDLVGPSFRLCVMSLILPARKLVT